MKTLFKTFVIALLLAAGIQNASAQNQSYVTVDPNNSSLYNATLYGWVDYTSPVQAWIQVDGKGQYGNGSYMGQFSAYVPGLTCSTTYTYYTTLYWNGQTIPDANKKTLTTGVCGGGSFVGGSSVTTNSATNITQTSATLNGYVSSGSTQSSSVSFATNLNNGTITVGPQTVTNGSFSYYLSGLTCNTTYQYYAQSGSSYGSLQSFTTSACNGNNNNNYVSVTTNSATNITQTSATLNGYSNAYGTVSFSTNIGNGTVTVGSQSASGSFSYYLSGLTCNTTYQYYAQSGSSYGSLQSFTTSACNGNNNNNYVSVTTNSATNITQTSATLNGYANGYGSAWFGTNLGNGTVTVGSQTSNGTSNGTFSYYVGNLTCNTTYQYYAAAQSSNGSTSYGSVQSFTTSACNGNNNNYNNNNIRSITTAATGVGYTSARLNGLVLPWSSPSVAYFEYGTTASLGNRTVSKTYYESGSVPAIDVLTGLSQGTTYYYRVVGEKDGARAYGDIVSFKTYVYTETSPETPPTKTTTTPAKQNTGIVYIPVQLSSVNLAGTSGITTPRLADISVKKISSSQENCEGVYEVVYTNTSSSTLSNVLVNIVLPNELAFVNATVGQYRETDSTLSVPVGNMNPGQSGKVTITTQVLDGAQIGKTVSITGYLNYTDATTNAQDQVTGYTLLTINDSCDTTVIGTGGAGAVGLTSFLPGSLFQWILVIIAIAVIIFAARNLFVKKDHTA